MEWKKIHLACRKPWVWSLTLPQEGRWSEAMETISVCWAHITFCSCSFSWSWMWSQDHAGCPKQRACSKATLKIMIQKSTEHVGSQMLAPVKTDTNNFLTWRGSAEVSNARAAPGTDRRRTAQQRPGIFISIVTRNGIVFWPGGERKRQAGEYLQSPEQKFDFLQIACNRRN